MKSLLESGFNYLEYKLTRVSPMLAVVVPHFASHYADGTSLWLAKLLQANWSDAILDLVEYFHPDCEDRLDAKYQLTAF
eukprot:5252415-Karenia_brevis.AAC.1